MSLLGDVSRHPVLSKEQPMRSSSTRSLTAAALAFTVGCGSTPEPVAVRLVDLFQPDVVAGSPVVDPPGRTEWRFDGAMP
ncbi:MAG: hypothetical protein IIA44_09305, partial [Acidobacteria bacterium]|nr:hypothetical protein [Acidobacteriota bacterium]